MNNNIILKKGKHLNYQDKLKIEGFLGKNNIIAFKNGYATNVVIKNTKKKYRSMVNEISKYIGRCERTIKRELERGKIEKVDFLGRIYFAYSADVSHTRYKEIRKSDTRKLKIDDEIELFYFIANLLKKKHSAYACIQLAIKAGYSPKFTSRTLLNYIIKGLFEFIDIKHNFSLYKLKKTKKGKYSKLIRKGIYNSIEDRPTSINERVDRGHLEIDTVVGSRCGKNKVLLVLTERYSRYQKIVKIKGKQPIYVLKALKRIILNNKNLIFKTITSDNGTEFYGTKDFCDSHNITWYYCHPYCSGERGSNENNNKFIRRFIAKGEKINKYSVKDINKIEEYINNYPRKIFNGKSSKEIYFG